MKSMRKSLAFLVVLAMVITTVAPVFAATPADVAGTDFESAVGNLAALNIVSGDKETGNFRPNDNITRAEFARIACSMLGMEAAAALAKGPTKFKDVAASHWASGYINVAAEKGIIKGYPGGLFKPDENVTYAEAITVLVRALGMGDYVDKQGGTWPGNYLSAGSIAGITSGISSFAGDAKAIRGTIGQLAWNTLEAEKWGAKEYSLSGIVYGPLGKTLLEEQYKDYVFKDSDDKYQTKFFTDVKVVGTQIAGGLDADQIELDVSGKSSLKDMLDLDSDDDTKVVDVKATGVDLNSLFGKKVNIFFGKDNKVYSIVVVSKDVVTGFVTDFDKAENKIEMKKVGTEKEGKKYSFKSNAKIYLNTKNYSAGTVNDHVYSLNERFDTVADLIGDSTAKVDMVLDGGSVDTINILVPDKISISGIEMEQVVVKEVNKDNVIKKVGESASKVVDLDDVTTDEDQYVILKNDKPVAASEIKAGDVLTYIHNTDTGLYYLVLTDNKLKGKVTEISDDSKATNNEVRKTLTIDGKDYDMVNDGNASYTKSNSFDEDDVKDDITDSAIDDFDGKEVTLTLNAVNEIILISGNVSSSDSGDFQVGVITRKLTTDGDDYNLKILTPSGTAKAFTVSGDDYRVLDKKAAVTKLDDDASYSEKALDASGADAILASGVVVIYNVGANSKISAEDLYVVPSTVTSINDEDDDVYLTFVPTSTAFTIKDNTKKIIVGGETYRGTSSTAYMNMDANDDHEVKKIDGGWDSIVKDDADQNDAGDDTILDETDFYIVADDDNDILSIIVCEYDEDDLLSSEYNYGVFVKSFNKDGDKYIRVFMDGATKDYEVAGSVYNVLAKGDLIRFETDSSGKAKVTTADEPLRADKSVIEAIVKADSDSDEAKSYQFKKFDKDDYSFEFEKTAVRYGEDDTDSEDGITDRTPTLAKDVVVYDAINADDIKKVDVANINDYSGDYAVVDDYSDADGEYNVVIFVKD